MLNKLKSYKRRLRPEIKMVVQDLLFMVVGGLILGISYLTLFF